MQLFFRLAPILALYFFASCSQPKERSQTLGFASSLDDRWPQQIIPVCFEQENAFDLDKQTVEAAVRAAYEPLGFSFPGWGLCTPEQKGVRIRFDSEASVSRTEGFGLENDGVIAGLTLGLSTSCSLPFSGSACEANIALHEFGHALGLRHEMNRRDDPGCIYRQPGGDTGPQIQIGPYDPDSIMNYCKLYGANENGTRLRLSQGDRQALLALYAGPLASIQEAPPYVIKDSFQSAIHGRNLASYRFAFGPKAETNCLDAAAYGDLKPITEPLQLSSAQASAGVLHTLCVLGRDQSGRDQDLGSYTSVDFFMQSLAEAETMQLAPGPEFSSPPEIVRNADGTVDVLIHATHEAPLKSLGVRLAYLEGRPFTAPRRTLAHPRSKAPGLYSVSFKPEDFRVNGTLFLSSLYVTDIYGRTQSLDDFSGAGNYIDSAWPVPRLEVDFAKSRAPDLPQLLGIEIPEGPLVAGEATQVALTFEAPTELSSARLIFEAPGGERYAPLAQLLETDHGFRSFTLHLNLIFPRSSENGSYQLQRVILEDQSGNSRVYNLAADPSAANELVALTRELRGRAEREREGPRLLNWLSLPREMHDGEEPFIDFKVFELSGLKSISLKLAHDEETGLSSVIYGIDRGEVAGRRRIALNLTGAPPRGLYYVQEIMLEDRWGNQTWLKARREDAFFPGTNLWVPRLWLKP